MTTPLVRTRTATLDDVPALSALYARLSSRTIERRFHVPLVRVPERLVRALAVPGDGWSLVAEQGERVVGHGCVGAIGSRTLELGLVVEDACHGTGIGTRLVRDLAASAAERGFEVLVCTVEPDNRSVSATLRRAGLEPVPSYVDGAVELRVTLPVQDEPGDHLHRDLRLAVRGLAG